VRGDPGVSRRAGCRSRGALGRVLTLLAAGCLLAPPVSTLAADTPRFRISQLVVSSSPTHLILFAQLADALDEEALTALQDGLPLRFEFQVEIYRERQMWPDGLLASLTLAHTIKYDLMQQRYELTSRYGERETRRSTASLGEARRWVSSLDGVRILPRDGLRGGRRYYLLLRAAVVPDEDPLARNIYFFKKSGRRETDWERSPLFGIGGKPEP
jgi:hypothetical protein